MTPMPMQIYPTSIDPERENELVLFNFNVGGNPSIVIELLDAATGSFIRNLEAGWVSETEIHILLPTHSLAVGAYKVSVKWRVAGQEFIATTAQVLTVVREDARIFLPFVTR